MLSFFLPTPNMKLEKFNLSPYFSFYCFREAITLSETFPNKRLQAVLDSLPPLPYKNPHIIQSPHHPFLLPNALLNMDTPPSFLMLLLLLSFLAVVCSAVVPTPITLDPDVPPSSLPIDYIQVRFSTFFVFSTVAFLSLSFNFSVIFFSLFLLCCLGSRKLLLRGHRWNKLCISFIHH